MLNFSPVGRSCTYEERVQFFEFDKVHRVREQFVEALRQRWGFFSDHFSKDVFQVW
jgi:phosphomannomutase